MTQPPTTYLRQLTSLPVSPFPFAHFRSFSHQINNNIIISTPSLACFVAARSRRSCRSSKRRGRRRKGGGRDARIRLWRSWRSKWWPLFHYLWANSQFTVASTCAILTFQKDILTCIQNRVVKLSFCKMIIWHCCSQNIFFVMPDVMSDYLTCYSND